MKNLASTHIVFAPLGRRVWYRRVNWVAIGLILLSCSVTGLIIWFAAKAVR